MDGAPKGFLVSWLDRLGLKGARARWVQGALMLAAMGVAMLLMASPMGLSRPAAPVGQEATQVVAPSSDLAGFEAEMAQRLEAILGRVAGVGQVRVQISLAAGPAKVVQVDQKKTSRTTQEKDTSGGTRQVTELEESGQMVMVRGGSGPDAPVVLQTHRPEVAGVLVVAEGAGDPRVREELARAVGVALGIPLNHIRIEEGR